MTRRTLLAVVAAACIALTLGLLGRKTEAPSPEATTEQVTRRTRYTRSATLDDKILAWQDLYTNRGYLSEAQTLALKAERAAAAEAIAAEIASGDAGVVADTLDRARSAEGSREKLVLIAGLGRNPSPEAVLALGAVYEEADYFRLKEESLRALGASEAEGRNELLVETMSSENTGLSQIAAMALYGEADEVPSLVSVATDTQADMNTRLEAVSSIGGVHTEAGQAALGLLRDDAALEARVRQYADKVLVREQM